jgi:hypothetical protein
LLEEIAATISSEASTKINFEPWLKLLNGQLIFTVEALKQLIQSDQWSLPTYNSIPDRVKNLLEEMLFPKNPGMFYNTKQMLQLLKTPTSLQNPLPQPQP